MRVCYWGTFEREYPRNQILISGLRLNGVEVVECHFPLWKEGFRYNKLVLSSGLKKKLGILWRALVGYPCLIFHYLFLAKHEAVVVGYLGHFDVLALAPFAKIRRKPVIFDAFFSLYDSAVSDWGTVKVDSFLARILLLLDRISCNLADLVLVDTRAQKEFFCKQFRLPESKVRAVYVGADDSVFSPVSSASGAENLRVLYVGNFVPLHGVPVIIEAAKMLAHENIEFWMIGDQYDSFTGLRSTTESRESGRFVFFSWMPPRELRKKIAEADVCLGLFGTSEKAMRVIPGKAFLSLAMGKALITGDSPAARELLENGRTAVLCELGSSRSLAAAIVELQRDPIQRKRIGEEGRRLFETQCTPRVLGSQFASLIREAAASKN